jgi:hypothetical protein
VLGGYDSTAMRLTVQFGGALSRGAFISIFAFTCAAAAKPQEKLIPQLSREQPAGENDQQNSQFVRHSKPDLPDAPRRLPLQARRLTLGERFRIYRHSVINPDSLLAPAFGAALGQASNEPPEWGQGASGYGTRLASGYGRLVINRTIRFGVAALDHEDPRFSYSNESGFWRRFRYASVHYVVARTDSGKQIPAFSRFAGTYGAAFIANEWYPESRANTSHALTRGSAALAAGWGWNVFREFWPDIKKALHRSKDQD